MTQLDDDDLQVMVMHQTHNAIKVIGSLANEAWQFGHETDDRALGSFAMALIMWHTEALVSLVEHVTHGGYGFDPTYLDHIEAFVTHANDADAPRRGGDPEWALRVSARWAAVRRIQDEMYRETVAEGREPDFSGLDLERYRKGEWNA